jgi:hypothetical protein
MVRKFGHPKRHLKRWLVAVSSSVMMLAVQSSAFAQCIMCKTAIAGSSDAAKTAAKFDIGVLVLLGPVVVIIGVIVRLIYRYRDSFAAVEVNYPD